MTPRELIKSLRNCSASQEVLRTQGAGMLKQARQSGKVPIKRITDKLGVSRMAYNHWESGRQCIPVARFAEILEAIESLKTV